MFRGGVAVQDLDHEPGDDGGRVEDAMAPGVPGLAARGSDRFGVKTAAAVLPQSLQEGIDPVMHQGASLCDGSSSNAVVPGGPLLLKSFARLNLSLA